MNILDEQGLKEQARLAELNRQAAVLKEKIDATQNKQKIILGGFLVDLLSKNGIVGNVDIDALKEYTAENLLSFCEKDDRKVMKPIIKSLSKNDKKTATNEQNQTVTTKEEEDNNQYRSLFKD